MNDLHPCKGKCSEYQDAACNNCLVEQIEKREFDLGVAPDDAYVKTIHPYGLDEAFKELIDEAFIEVFGVTTLP